jgi:hypothetical protein
MTNRLIAAATVAAFALLAPSAHAGAPYPGERLANNPTLDALVVQGQAYWHSQVPPVTPCAHPIVMFADDLRDPGEIVDVLGRTDWGGCVMRFLLDDSMRYMLSHPLDVRLTTDFGEIVTHELGHTAGLLFTDNPTDPTHSLDDASLMHATATWQWSVPSVAAWALVRASRACRARHWYWRADQCRRRRHD